MDTYSGLSLLDKVLLLCKVLFIKYRVIKLILVAKPIELNDYAKDKFNEVDWETLLGVRYKKIADATGEYRFFVPSISSDYVWRVNKAYSLSKSKVSNTLEFIVHKDGIRDEKRYKDVWK